MQRFYIVLISVVSFGLHAETYYNNWKMAFNKTGTRIAVSLHAHQLDPTYRYPIVVSYTVEPDSYNRLFYPGTSLRGITWQEDNDPSVYSYQVPGLDTQRVLIFHPGGVIEARS